MPKKITKKTVRKTKLKTENKSNMLSQVKWGESYASLLLGIVVVIVVAVLIFAFIKNNNSMENSVDSNSIKSEELGKQQDEYIVKENDDLWSISENIYKTGYNWTEIAKANNLENPGIIYVGQKLIIPEIKQDAEISNDKNQDESVAISEQEVEKESIKEDSYKIKSNDNLWDIAVKAYGDGYKWVEIAKANNLENPNLIHVDNILKLPR